MNDYVTCEHGRHRLCIKCAEEAPEPWCRECGVPVVDKDAHDRWHARSEGSASNPSVRSWDEAWSLTDEELASIRKGGLLPPSVGKVLADEYEERLERLDRLRANCRSTPSDSSVTRSEVSTNLNGNDPSAASS